MKTAIDALEEEQKLGLVYNDETKLFTGADGRLQIYVGDFFTCPLDKFGPFDYVWDRGLMILATFDICFVLGTCFRANYKKHSLKTQDHL